MTPAVPPSPFLIPRLVALLVVAHVSFGGARLTLTLQAVHLHASPLVVGVLMSLLTVVPSLTSVAIGRWTDRIGFLRPTCWGLGVVTAAELLAAAFPSLPVLGVTSVLVGSGFMVAHVAVYNEIGHAAQPAERVRAFGLTGMGFSLSALAGPLLAGLAIDHLGHRWSFLLMALFPVVSIALALGLPVRARDAVRAAATDTSLLGLVRHAPLRAVLGMSVMISVGWDLFTFLVPLHGVRQGLSATEIGIVVGAFGVGSFAARLALPWVAARVTEWKLLRGAVALAAAGYFVYPFCGHVATMLPLSFALGLVLGCGQPLVMSLLHVSAPPGRTAEAVGLRAALTSAGQTVLPLLFGALGAAAGMFPLFWTAATALGAGAAYSARRGSSSSA